MAGAKGRRWKCRSRPCSVCGKWFEPHPRVGKRQKTCGRESCQAELHQRARRRWRAAHPDWDRQERVRRRIRKADEEVSERARQADPMRQMAWEDAREVVGLEVSVIVEEASQMLVRWTREVVSFQPLEIKEESRQIQDGQPREEIGDSGDPGLDSRAPP